MQKDYIVDNRYPQWSEEHQCYTVVLTKGFTTLIDECDVERVGKYKWSVQNSKSKNVYAFAATNGFKKAPSLMHRYILGDTDGLEIDHINGNGLDNRRSNLRLATRAQNQGNTGKRSDNTSGYKGVFHIKSGQRNKRWVAQIKVDGKVFRSSYFFTPEEAAVAYDELATTHFGEFARLNFPKSSGIDDSIEQATSVQK